MHFFRNITAYSYKKELDFTALEPALEELAFAPCSEQSMSSEGFVHVIGQGTDEAHFTHHYAAGILFAVQSETRIIPPRVVDDRLAQLLDSIEKKEGRRPGSRERKRLKEEVVHDLMAKSFTSKIRTRALLDTERGLLLVDTASRKVADGIVSHLRSAMGSFPCYALSTRQAPAAWMTDLVRSGNLPSKLELGDACVLKGPESAKVTIKNLDLRGEDVQGHVDSGMFITQVDMVRNDEFSWVLDDALTVRKFNCLAEVDMPDSGEIEAEINARIFLLLSHYRILLDQLDEQLGINYAA